MSSITLRMSDEENEIDLDIYNQAMKEHKENPQDIGFDEMIAELGFNE